MTTQSATGRIQLQTLVENERELGALSALIGRVYECAIDPGQWDDTLGEIVAALSPPDWDVILLQWERISPPGCRFVGSTSLIPMAREIYRTMFAGRNPWSRRIWALPAGRVVDTDEIMPRSEILESEFYKKFLHTWNLQIAIGVVLDRQGPEKLGLIMPGPPGHPIDGLKRGFRLLAPHMQRAVRISRALGEANLRSAAAQSAIEAVPNAILSLTPALKVMSANAKALELIEAGWAKMIDGGLVLTDRKAQQQLVELAAAAPPTSAAFRTAGPDGGDLAVLAARLTTQTAETLDGRIEGAGIILTIGIGARAPLIEINRLASWFGLTPAEARLAASLSSGMTPDDYAARRNVSMNAVRFLLKGIYRKTSVGSQAQLIAQIRNLPLH
ncbi:MAG TPA: helix-turn-helix transcriptional regulator [Steroidobacteraceae bacterium]